MGTNIMQNTREIVATLNNNNDVISRFKYDLPIDVANTEMLVKIYVKRSKWHFDIYVRKQYFHRHFEFVKNC